MLYPPFLRGVSFALLVFDATSVQSFEALEAKRDAFLRANPQYDARRLAVVSNVARLGVKRAVSYGYAADWCAQRGGISLFEIDSDNPQGILEPLQHLARLYVDELQVQQ